MPIYEYACEACGHAFEALQKVSEKPLRRCPECGRHGLRKLVSAPSFRLKGGGWYETDFKSANKRNLADGGKEEKPAAKSGESASAEPVSGKPAKPDKAGPAGKKDKADKPKVKEA